MIDTTRYISRCCKAQVSFYDWYICAECGETIHDPVKDADLATPVSEPESGEQSK